MVMFRRLQPGWQQPCARSARHQGCAPVPNACETSCKERTALLWLRQSYKTLQLYRSPQQTFTQPNLDKQKLHGMRS